MGVEESFSPDSGELEEGELQKNIDSVELDKKKSENKRFFINKDMIVQFLWKFKFIDKRIFIGIGFFFTIAVVFYLAFFISHNTDSSLIEEDDIFDPFSDNILSKTPLEEKIDSSKFEEEDANSGKFSELSEKIDSVSSSELFEGVRARLAVGDTLELDMDLARHELSIDSINGESVEVTIMSDPIFTTFKFNIPKKFDLNKDGVYDLEIELLEIVDKEGILAIQEIKEFYDVDSEEATSELIETETGFVYVSVEDVPYSCVRKDGYVEYFYLRIWKDGENIFDEKMYGKTIYDSCPTHDSFIQYSCGEDNVLVSTDGNCSSRLETCFEGNCIISSYERNMGKSGSPEENYLGENECYFIIGDTTFWVSSEEEICRNLFIADAAYVDEDLFGELLEYYEYDISMMEDGVRLRDISVSYVSNLDNINYFDDIKDKLVSDKCETLEFLGIDLYCFNGVDEVINHKLEYMINIITFFNNLNLEYDSFLVDVSPYNFLIDDDITFIYGAGSEFYDGLYLNQDSGCSEGDLFANYENIDGKNNIFVCDGLLTYLTPFYRVAYASVIYREALEMFEGRDEKCYESTKIEYYTENLICDYCKDYGTIDENNPFKKDDIKRCDKYDDSNTDIECFIDDKPNDCDICNDWETLTRYIPSERDIPAFYNNFDSLYGEYINYLYGMSQDDGLLYVDRQKFYSLAVAEFNDFGCDDGPDSDYKSMVYP